MTKATFGAEEADDPELPELFPPDPGFRPAPEGIEELEEELLEVPDPPQPARTKRLIVNAKATTERMVRTHSLMSYEGVASGRAQLRQVSPGVSGGF